MARTLYTLVHRDDSWVEGEPLDALSNWAVRHRAYDIETLRPAKLPQYVIWRMEQIGGDLYFDSIVG